MTGIQLTPQRRSQLLELLLSQKAQRPQIQTGLEAALRLGAQGIRQKGINDLQEQESAAEKRRGSQEAAALAELTGAPVRSVFGTELPDSGGQGAQLANLLKNNPNSPIAQAIAAAQIRQATTSQGPGDPFTLSPGEGRFDAQGNPIASLPDRPSAGSGFTLSPGQNRFDANGNLIRSIPDRPDEPDKPSARELKIRDLMSTLGFTREEAVAEVDKLRDIKVTTEGRALLVDNTNPRQPDVTEIPISGNPLTVPEFSPDETLFGLAGEATGPGNIIKGKFAPLGAALGMSESMLPTDTTSAQQFFSAAENSVIRGFALNPKFPIAEQNRIKENINVGPKFFDSPELMQQRMFAVDTFLKNEEAKFLSDSQDTGLANTTRRSQAANAVNVRSFRNALGVTPDIRQLVENEGLTPAEAFELIQLRKEQDGG